MSFTQVLGKYTERLGKCGEAEAKVNCGSQKTAEIAGQTSQKIKVCPRGQLVKLALRFHLPIPIAFGPLSRPMKEVFFVLMMPVRLGKKPMTKES